MPGDPSTLPSRVGLKYPQLSISCGACHGANHVANAEIFTCSGCKLTRSGYLSEQLVRRLMNIIFQLLQVFNHSEVKICAFSTYLLIPQHEVSKAGLESSQAIMSNCPIGGIEQLLGVYRHQTIRSAVHFVFCILSLCLRICHIHLYELSHIQWPSKSRASSFSHSFVSLPLSSTLCYWEPVVHSVQHINSESAECAVWRSNNHLSHGCDHRINEWE